VIASAVSTWVQYCAGRGSSSCKEQHAATHEGAECGLSSRQERETEYQDENEHSHAQAPLHLSESGSKASGTAGSEQPVSSHSDEGNSPACLQCTELAGSCHRMKQEGREAAASHSCAMSLCSLIKQQGSPLLAPTHGSTAEFYAEEQHRHEQQLHPQQPKKQHEKHEHQEWHDQEGQHQEQLQLQWQKQVRLGTVSPTRSLASMKQALRYHVSAAKVQVWFRKCKHSSYLMEWAAKILQDWARQALLMLKARREYRIKRRSVLVLQSCLRLLKAKIVVAGKRRQRLIQCLQSARAAVPLEELPLPAIPELKATCSTSGKVNSSEQEGSLPPKQPFLLGMSDAPHGCREGLPLLLPIKLG
ncbi:unnamed protein product, partial [Chrysoparadoxa australica]